MKLDETLAREIKALNGDGSRFARFETLQKVKAARAALSTTEVRDKFTDCLRTHGRAITALCVASTLYTRRERLDGWGLRWALAVLEHWTNKMPSFIDIASIDDQLHPTRICEYAGDFIMVTTEEGVY